MVETFWFIAAVFGAMAVGLVIFDNTGKRKARFHDFTHKGEK